MSDSSIEPGRIAARTGIAMIVVLVAAVGCVDPQDTLDGSDYFDNEDGDAEVSDPVEFTDESYDDVSGEMTIEQLRSMAPEDEVVWSGFDRPYPVENDCEPDMPWETVPATPEEFPVEIEGIVTLHPRYFENTDFCGARQDYQGTYVIQDETGGVHVFKDSRIADADIGDRVRLRVRGFMKSFDTDAVLAFDNEELVNDPNESVPVYYEELEREFTFEDDLYEVRRIRGEVVTEPTHQNFGDMVIQSTENPDLEWSASLDRELGKREVGPDKGDIVELTGPIVDSFGLQLVVATLGQIETIEAADSE